MGFLISALSGFDFLNSNLDITSGLLYALLGYGFVFLILGVLIIFVSLLKLVGRKKAEAKVGGESAGIVEMSAVSSGSENEEEEIAAVMAAISCYYGADADEPAPFKVRNIYRKL